MTRRVWYDCEFIEDGRTIDLISIGMVDDAGAELYAVAQEIEENPLYERIGRHRWLMTNVVPHLPLRPDSEVKLPEAQYAGSFHLDGTSNVIMPRRMLRNAVRDYLLGPGEPVELWAWYGAYDHVCLAQLFGSMIRLPKGIPMWTNDLRQEVQRLGDPQLPDQPDGLHNPLADARHLKTRHAYLENLGS